ncbi:hypothetical protein JL720_12862 [Aureococcus anophagefferens]|nr:hypothetical protein JL720_12862 [Aureococcus anophagefferens]
MRTQAGWTWSFPGEPAAYAQRQEERKREILGLEHYQERLDNWVQYTQTRSVPNFTKNGFDVVDIDPALHERLKTRLHAGLERARKEGEVQGIYGANGPTFVNHGERDLLKELLPTMEAWVPTVQGGLTPVTAYGMRAYHRGASLAFHADRVDTHIVSGILHVDHAYDDEAKPWPIEIEGHDGLRHSVALKPGQMLLYESAKCPHGRSSRAKTLDPALLEAAEAAAEAASDDPPPEETPRGLLRPDEVDRDQRRRAPPRRLKVADDLDDAEAELAETEGDDGSNLEFADDAGRSATGRKLKGRSRRRIPSRTAKNKRGGPSRARSAVAKKLAENKKKRHLHRAAPQRTKDDDDDDDEPEEDDDDDDDEVETIIGGGFVLAGLGYWIGGISALSACSIFIRRAIVTKGRSLKEVCGGKSKKDSDLPTFTPQK